MKSTIYVPLNTGGFRGTFAPPKKKPKNQINTKERKQREREERERERRGSVSSPQIIIITCKSILISSETIIIVLSDHLAEFRPP